MSAIGSTITFALRISSIIIPALSQLGSNDRLDYIATVCARLAMRYASKLPSSDTQLANLLYVATRYHELLTTGATSTAEFEDSAAHICASVTEFTTMSDTSSTDTTHTIDVLADLASPGPAT